MPRCGKRFGPTSHPAAYPHPATPRHPPPQPPSSSLDAPAPPPALLHPCATAPTPARNRARRSPGARTARHGAATRWSKRWPHRPTDTRLPVRSKAYHPAEWPPPAPGCRATIRHRQPGCAPCRRQPRGWRRCGNLQAGRNPRPARLRVIPRERQRRLPGPAPRYAPAGCDHRPGPLGACRRQNAWRYLPPAPARPHSQPHLVSGRRSRGGHRSALGRFAGYCLRHGQLVMAGSCCNATIAVSAWQARLMVSRRSTHRRLQKQRVNPGLIDPRQHGPIPRSAKAKTCASSCCS